MSQSDVSFGVVLQSQQDILVGGKGGGGCVESCIAGQIVSGIKPVVF